LRDVEKKIGAGGGAMNDAFSLFQEGAGFKFDQRNFEVQRAQTEAMTSANGAISKLAEAQTWLYQQYPGFGAAIEGAKPIRAVRFGPGSSTPAIWIPISHVLDPLKTVEN
jgi:hypothetical protein